MRTDLLQLQSYSSLKKKHRGHSVRIGTRVSRDEPHRPPKLLRVEPFVLQADRRSSSELIWSPGKTPGLAPRTAGNNFGGYPRLGPDDRGNSGLSSRARNHLRCHGFYTLEGSAQANTPAALGDQNGASTASITAALERYHLVR